MKPAQHRPTMRTALCFVFFCMSYASRCVGYRSGSPLTDLVTRLG